MTDVPTPRERRARVFISALLPELALERQAATEAVESLHLQPVTADDVARPAELREVELAHLETCHVFVGIYGTGYGRAEGGAATSEIHEEYERAAAMPRLLYLRSTSEPPEPRLAALIREFQAADDASYAHFDDPAELRLLVAADIAALLTERFFERADEDARPSLGVRPTLPAPPAPLVGRLREVGEVRDLMALHRLVTITGPGGTGKTRLAIEALRSLEDAATDGPWFVDLSGLSHAGDVAPAVEGALGVIAQPHGGGVEGLAAIIGSRRMLLVLDNCEHVIDGAAALVAALLERCPELRVLCTSRQPLRIKGEQLYPLAPLPVAVAGRGGGLAAGDAMRLFEARARQHRTDFELDAANFEVVRRIVSELDGLPLAVELAAARLRVLNLDQLAQRLGSRFALLSGGPRDAPDRHRGLAATIDWSFALLDAREQDLFLRLAVFRGGFELDAVTSVTGWDDLEVVDLLAGLVEKSLVVPDAGAAGRYGMLQSLREYALWRMSDEERRDLVVRHLRWLVGLASDLGPKLFGADAAASFARLTREQDNVRAALTGALEVGDGASAVAIAGDLGWFWYRRGQVEEGQRWIEASLAAAGAGPNPKRPLAAVSLGGLHYLRGDVVRAAELCLGAREEAGVFDDVPTLGRAITYAAYFIAFTGDLARAYALASEARDIGIAREVPMVVAEASSALGQLLRLQGRLVEAEGMLTEAARIARAGGNRWLEGSATWIAAKVDLDAGHVPRALARLRYCLRLQAHEGDITSTLVGLHTMAAALTAAGDPERGANLLGAVAAIGGRIGFRPERMDVVDGPRAIESVRAALDEESFAAAFAAGERLELQDALSLAGYGSVARGDPAEGVLALRSLGSARAEPHEGLRSEGAD